MKKFIFVSLFAFALCADAWACISEAPTHNNYMFSVFRRESMDSPFREDINAYWKRYAGDMSDTSTDYYRWNRDKIDAAARSRGDVLMQRYMKLLDSYLQVCDEVSYDSWDYPTKEQLTKRKSTLNSIRNSATMAMKTGLRELNALMVMRANMMLGYDQANISFWNSTAQNLPKGVWREVARNIYARALLNTGKRIEACNIYAEQGDMQSIKWSMRNYRNLAGIQKIYLDDPNSPTLIYLVQDFVNNVQETLDQATGTGTDEDWIKTIDARVVYKADAMRFVDFANNVVRSGKNEYPCLWKSAIGMIYYLFGMSEEAVAELDEAMAMDGTPRMKDNARCIRLLASTGCNMFSPSYSAYLLKEMQRLDELIRDERGTSDIYPNHYTDVKERVVYNALVPKCMATGRVNMALALLGMMEENEQDFYTKGRHSQPDYVIEGDYAWNSDYSPWNEYFAVMDTISADVLAGYLKYISMEQSDPFEQYVVSQVYPNKNYYNDLIGTRYMAEGRFADALPYLEKVSLGFLSQQNISWYMANRKYSLPRWFNRQLPNMPDTDGPGKGEPKENMKLKYCKDMLQLQANYDLAREGEQKDMRAYELAVMHYQASCYGDCWFLTHYGHSIYDSTRNGEFDFARKTVEYLNKCVVSSDLNMRYKALYALVFVDKDPWFDVKYDRDYNPVYIPRPASSQYKAMSALYSFARQHPQYVDGYTTRCDMLKAFARVSGQ